MLRHTFDRCLASVRSCCCDFEIVLLDDGSSDRTFTIMEQIHREYPQKTFILRHERNLGIAKTFEDLYSSATKEWLFLIPADGEYPPEVLPQCLPLFPTCDAIVCQRRQKYYSLYRKVLSGLFRFLPRILFGVELYDPGSVKCVKRSIITDIPIASRGVFAEAERLIRALKRGYRIAAVPIEHRARTTGNAKGASWRYVKEASLDLCTLWINLVVRRKPA